MKKLSIPPVIPKYFVVYEDAFNNKYTFKGNELASIITKVLTDFELRAEYDLNVKELKPDLLNNIYYDIPVLNKLNERDGRIMIFVQE